MSAEMLALARVVTLAVAKAELAVAKRRPAINAEQTDDVFMKLPGVTEMGQRRRGENVMRVRRGSKWKRRRRAQPRRLPGPAPSLCEPYILRFSPQVLQLTAMTTQHEPRQ